MKKPICKMCDNGEKIILKWDISDIDNLRDKIQKFCFQEEMSCEYEDVSIEINAKGDIFLSANFKSYIVEKL